MSIFQRILMTLTAACCLSLAGSHAATTGAHCRRITMDDGLPSNTVRNIVQDRFGFLWFGTDNGLCRYDGTQVQTFRIAELETSQYVSALTSTDEGLYIGTERGVYFYDFAQQQGYRFLALTASDTEAVHRWQDLTGAEYSFEFMDELVLKTIARTNPAIVLLHDGRIIGKWAAGQLGSDVLTSDSFHEMVTEAQEPEPPFASLLYLFVLYALPLVPLTLADRIVFALKKWIRSRRKTKNN